MPPIEDVLSAINRANDAKPLPPHVVVWEPIPLSSQEFALDSRANHTLYTGSRGPGKTDTQLMRFARRVGLGYGAAWRGIIFDREYKHLDDLIAKSKKWFPRIFKGKCRFLESKGDYKWIWDTGEELLFRVIKKKSDYDNYHGHEYPFIGWNELTKYPTLELYDMMMSCNRSSWTQEKDSERDPKTGEFLTPPIPLEVFATCNSSGPGHRAVKKRFIDVAPYGTVVEKKINVFDPKTKKRIDVVRTQVAIFGSYKENIYLDTGYIAELESIKDPNRRKSWLEGSWDVVSGGAFDDLWKRHVHVVPRFVVPENWYIDRSFDWGSSSPFSVGWWCEANGEEVKLLDGRTICFVKGSLIRCNEWYGADPDAINAGLRLGSKKIAEGIRDKEIWLLERGWMLKQPSAGPADNQIRNVSDDDTETIEKKMSDVGIRWQPSDKSKGTRIQGVELFRERLENANKGEGPGVYFMDHCSDSIGQLPVLPRDPDDLDDVDSEAEDHIWDEVRYRILKGNDRYAKNVKVTFAA